jgi:Squalene-hopene cyclase C-terminal domain
MTMEGRAMKTALVACLLLAVLVAPAATDPKELPKEEWPLQKRINAAIDRGVAHLKKTQGADGSWRGQFGSAGQTALALFTLVSWGAGKTDPAVIKAVTYLTKLKVAAGTGQAVQSDRPPAIRMTYAHSLLVLAMTTLDPKKHKASIKRSVRVLVENQKKNGQWAYIVTMGGPLDQGDNSNTQFALLALRRALRAGFKVPKAVWQRSYKHFEKTLAADGGWGYGCPGSLKGTYGSMTAVGIASMVICKAMLLGDRAAAQFAYLKIPQITKAMIWLEDRFTADGHPGIAKVNAPGGGGQPGGASPMMFQYYWLYAVERVGMLLGQKYIGDHDWYKEGAEWLVDNQMGNGGWRNPAGMMVAPEPPLAATCFALLFLKKATLPIATPPVR